MNLRDAFDAPVPVIVLAEGEFGSLGGKTANGVVMHSELFDAGAVIDSTRAGQSAREVLGKPDAPDIPVVSSLDEALTVVPDAAALIVGVAPAGGALPERYADTIRAAVTEGCDIVSGLHVFLGEDPEWQELAAANGARIFDVRKPPSEEALGVADGRVDDEVDAGVVLTMGTDCAVGKRTTTFELYRTARADGLDAAWIATGQTGIMVGAQRGVVVDRVPADFVAGVVEDLICDVAADHDVVFVEGQASLFHRAYSGVTLGILHGAWPDAVVIVDDPNRDRRAHFESFPVAGVERERSIIEEISSAEVAAISTWGDAAEESRRFGLPAGNVYTEDGASQILDSVLAALDLPESP